MQDGIFSLLRSPMFPIPNTATMFAATTTAIFKQSSVLPYLFPMSKPPVRSLPLDLSDISLFVFLQVLIAVDFLNGSMMKCELDA